MSRHDELQSVAVRVNEEILAATGCVNACILAARVVVDLLGAEAEAEVRVVSCAVEALNAAAQGLLERATDALAFRAAWTARGARWVAAGVESSVGPGTGYDGHVVAVVDRRWIVDPSLGQFARPQMHLGPVALPISDRAFLHGTKTEWFENIDGTCLSYRVRPGATSFRTSPDWQRGDVASAIADRVRSTSDAGVCTAPAPLAPAARFG